MPGMHASGHGPVPVPRLGREDGEPRDPAVQMPHAPRPESAQQNGAVPSPLSNGAAPLHERDGSGGEEGLLGGEAVLGTNAVTFVYPDGTVALRDLTLSIPRGRRVAILGANGSGKSTFFLTLNGILKPAQGRVLLGGAPVRYDRAGLNHLRKRVGLVFQDPDSQLFAASVRQDISFGPINLGLSAAEVKRRVEVAIADTQIEDLADRPTHLLSHGQKKRVAIAGVLAMDPEVIVADEPTAGLDPEMTVRLLELLSRLHVSGRTIVISTHDLDLALAWADVAFVLRRGALISSGSCTSVFSDSDLLRSARLVPPIVLQTFLDLRARGVLPPDCPPPRDAAQLAACIAGYAGIHAN